MKTKLLCTIALCFVLIVSLACCKGNEGSSGGAGGSNNGANNAVENLIYSSNSELYIVYATDDDGPSASELSNEIYLASSNPARVISSEREIGMHEIVIGECEREVSKEAYKILRRAIGRNENDSGYLIYSDGSSVAIAYLGKSMNSARKVAVEYFIENFVSQTLVAAKGNLALYPYNEAERFEALDEASAAKGWAEFSDKYGDELTDSLKALYSVYDDNVVDWLANLYDADIGGFYFSNSARNYVGFLPDLESTYQALGFLENSGMVRAAGYDSYVEAIPEEMKAQVISFVKGLQYSNGYFYHPQWGQQLTDSRLSRRGRDLSWATGMLKKFGVSPTYDTPNGVKGDGVIEASSRLTSKMSSSVFKAVSKVVFTSSTSVPDHLKNKENFLSYLNSLNIKTDSYTVGNELAAQTAQIVQRDKWIVANTDYSLVDILIEWLNDNQNPQTGTWDYLSPGDPNYSVYRGMDGLFKILTIYNDVKRELPHAKEALESTKYCIDVDVEANIVCDVYNTWYTIDMIFENLEKYSSDRAAGAALASLEQAKLREEAPELIRASTKKILKFIQKDGAFEFQMDGGKSFESQGVPVSVPGIEESNVNATVICVSGVVNNIYGALGIPRDGTVPIYGAADMQRFLDIINDLSPIVKAELTYELEYFDFEGDEVGKAPDSIVTEWNSTGEARVVKYDKGNVLSLVSNGNGGDVAKFEVENKFINPVSFVFKSDICVDYVDRDAPLGDLSLFDENGNRIYMLYLLKQGNDIHLADVSSSNTATRTIIDFGRVASVGEWFNLKVEYYVGDHFDFRAKIYINDKLVSVSDNYFDSNGLKLEGGVGTPRNQYGETRLSIFSYINTKVLMDNVAVYHDRKVYEKPTSTNNLTYYVDCDGASEKKYDFENIDTIYSDFEITGDEPTFTPIEGNTVLSFNGNTEVKLPITLRETKANCVVFEATVNFESIKDKAQMNIIIGEDGYQNLETVGFAVLGKIDNGVKSVELYEYCNGSVGNLLSTVKLEMNKDFVLRIEYFEDTLASLIYLNGNLAGMSGATYENAKLRRSSHLHVVTNDKLTVTLDNVIFEKTVKSYEDASRPRSDEKVYDFTTLDSDVNTNGTLKSGGLYLASGGYLHLPINLRGVVYNAFSFTASLEIDGSSANSSGFTIKLTDDADKTLVSYKIIISAATAYIYEVTENGDVGACIGSFGLDRWEKVSFDFYLAETTANIFVNGTLVGITSVVYNSEEKTFAPTSLKLIVDGASSLYIDDVVAELNFKDYVKYIPNFDGQDEEIYGFESSSTGSLPSGLSAKLNSLGASLKVRELLVGMKYSRVLEFATGVGENDTLIFTNEKKDVTANCSIMSVDICFDATARWDTFKFFVGENTENYAYSFSLAVDYGVVYLDCIGVGTDGKTSQLSRHIIGKENEWFNLTMEYYYGEDVMGYLKVCCDGAIVAEQSGMFGTRRDSLSSKDFNNLTVYSYSSTKASLWFDNLSIECVEKTFVNTLPGAKGEYYNAHVAGTVSGTVYDFSDGSTSCVTGINGGSSSSMAILSDKKYLSISKTVESTSTISKGLNFEAATEGTTETVIEMDIRINGKVDDVWPLFKIGFENRGYSREIYFGTTADGLIKPTNGIKNATDGFEGFEAGKWYNVRIVVSADTNAIADETGYADVYVDNTYVCQAKINGKGTSSKNRVVLTHLAKALVGCSIEVDNLFVGHN